VWRWHEYDIMTIHAAIVIIQVSVFLVASIVLVRKGHEKGSRLMLAAVVFEIIMSPIIWRFSEELNLREDVWIIQSLWAFSTLAFAIGLVMYAFETRTSG